MFQAAPYHRKQDGAERISPVFIRIYGDALGGNVTTAMFTESMYARPSLDKLAMTNEAPTATAVATPC